MLIVSFPGINGTISYRALWGFNNVGITLKWKCDSEVVLIASRYTKAEGLEEVKNKKQNEKC